MNEQTIPLDYANSLMYEMEKAFWDERGKRRTLPYDDGWARIF